MSGPWSSRPVKTKPAISSFVAAYAKHPRRWAFLHAGLAGLGGLMAASLGAPLGVAILFMASATLICAAQAVFLCAPAFDKPRPLRLLGGAGMAIGLVGAVVANGMVPRAEPTADARLDAATPRLTATANAAFGCQTDMTVERDADHAPVAVTLRCAPATPAA